MQWCELWVARGQLLLFDTATQSSPSCKRRPGVLTGLARHRCGQSSPVMTLVVVVVGVVVTRCSRSDSAAGHTPAVLIRC